MNQKEAKARILIDDLLTRSGWRFFDDDDGPANIALEARAKLKKKSIDDPGDDFEKTANGFVDYLLLGDRGFPIAVLEAKSVKFGPLVGDAGPALKLFDLCNVTNSPHHGTIVDAPSKNLTRDELVPLIQDALHLLEKV